jgi:hypothetical protein
MAQISLSEKARVRYDKFSSEQRDQVAARLMRDNLTTADEFNANQESYAEMGIESVDKLHNLINPRAKDIYKSIARYQEQALPTKNQINAAISAGSLTEDQSNKANSVLSTIEAFETMMLGRGVDLTDETVYTKLRKSNNRRNAGVPDISATLFDDVLAENNLAFLRLDG